jgi:hypothetical protein
MQTKALVSAMALLLSAPAAIAQEFRGKLIFSVEEVEWSLRINDDGSRGPKQRTGIFYYYEQGTPGAIGPSMTGYKLHEGKVVELSGAGSFEAGKFIEELTALPLSGFDVQAEIERTQKELRARNGPMMIVADGTRYRIRYDFNGVSIDCTSWNPGSYIDWLAPYNEKLGQLKAVIDLFATQYGRRQFGL